MRRARFLSTSFLLLRVGADDGFLTSGSIWEGRNLLEFGWGWENLGFLRLWKPFVRSYIPTL